MKITEVRTRVVQWEGATTPLPPHFCTNPMDPVSFRQASMGNFAFHGWVLVEIFTDTGLVGLGDAALSPLVTKTCIDTYLKPLLIGADPWDTEFLWQQMYRRTMAFGRKGVAMTAISAVDIAFGICWASPPNNPSTVCWADAPKIASPSMPAVSIPCRWTNCASRRRNIRMKVTRQ